MQTGILASEDRKSIWLQSHSNMTCSWVQDTQSAKDFDLFIDLNFDAHPDRITAYAGNARTTFLLSAVNCTPEMAFQKHHLKYQGEKIFGINAIPTFIEREILEATNPFELDKQILENLNINTQIEWVKSRVGMVTPRIVFMIINEAYFTFQEGTAGKVDIDTAMKLGTNYPKGPFEWCEQAGIENVYSTLLAIYEDTADERYKICPALKSEWIMKKVKA